MENAIKINYLHMPPRIGILLEVIFFSFSNREFRNSYTSKFAYFGNSILPYILIIKISQALKCDQSHSL